MSDGTHVDEVLEALEAAGLTHSWGTAAGAAMLGFEQALRSEPPPETVAGAHVPERGLAGEDEGTMLTFPDEVARKHR